MQISSQSVNPKVRAVVRMDGDFFFECMDSSAETLHYNTSAALMQREEDFREIEQE